MSVMVISSMAIIANIFVLIFHHRNVKIQKPMPGWVFDKNINQLLFKSLVLKTVYKRSKF